VGRPTVGSNPTSSARRSTRDKRSRRTDTNLGSGFGVHTEGSYRSDALVTVG